MTTPAEGCEECHEFRCGRGHSRYCPEHMSLLPPTPAEADAKARADVGLIMMVTDAERLRLAQKARAKAEALNAAIALDAALERQNWLMVATWLESEDAK